MYHHTIFNDHSNISKKFSPAEQNGAALVTSLIFLVILTLLGISASRGVIMQQLVARNYRDQDLALQAAEAALKSAESCIRNSNGLPTGPDSVATKCIKPGLAAPVSGTPYTNAELISKDATFWTTNGTAYGSLTHEPALTLNSGMLAQQPHYVISIWAQEPCLTCTNPQYAYQVTAWGTGINPNTQKIVQSIYVR